MCFFAGDADFVPGISGNDDVLTDVETDGQLKGRCIFVTRSLVQLAQGSQHDVPEAVHSLSRRWELMEQAFDDGSICVRMRNFLVFFSLLLHVYYHIYAF